MGQRLPLRAQLTKSSTREMAYSTLSFTGTPAPPVNTSSTFSKRLICREKCEEHHIELAKNVATDAMSTEHNNSKLFPKYLLLKLLKKHFQPSICERSSLLKHCCNEEWQFVLQRTWFQQQQSFVPVFVDAVKNLVCGDGQTSVEWFVLNCWTETAP